LEKIAFDGNALIGAATTIQTLSPTWNAMSYDQDSGTMYFVRDLGVPTLEKIAFDGNALIGAATTIQTLSPTWDAMALVYEPSTEPVPAPAAPALALIAIGLAGLAWSRRVSTKRALVHPAAY
jgi:hypothetical protein